MKNILAAAILLVASYSGANGIERFTKNLSSQGDNFTWEEILDNSFYQVRKSSFISPAGASLLNVCVYNDSQFRVIDPGQTCVAYKTKEVNVPRSGGHKTKLVKTCTQYKDVDFRLVDNTYLKCTKTVTTEDKNHLGKGREFISKCVESAFLPVPTKQIVDIYSTRKQELFQFSKVYEVPACEELGLN